jgi:hypothetical protein
MKLRLSAWARLWIVILVPVWAFWTWGVYNNEYFAWNDTTKGAFLLPLIVVPLVFAVVMLAKSVTLWVWRLLGP